jgi:cytochrome c-type biogenesis protein CcmF
LIRIIGYSALVIALMLSLFGAFAAVWGVRRKRPELIRSAEACAYTVFGLLALSTGCMVLGLVLHDFSIGYVAQVGSRSTPVFYTIISLWSALEGSILFWGFVLALYTAAAVYLNRGRFGDLMPYATATLLMVSAFFYILLVGPSNPFELVSPVPADGPGPNPLLQNHWLMAVHPPLLYLGYVGMTVPFAFAIGALLSGRLTPEWIRTTRRWTVSAWLFLTLAIVAGMWWSYEVLGWGGYWAWDPVENASFMPWLTATAFLHSVMVEERRGLLRAWNVSLIISTFLLTILGTFLTRSGVISSVHAFTEGTIGYWFLGFIAIVLVFSLVLLAGRSTEIRSEGHLDAVASRGTVFLVNNLVLVAFTFTVLLGTLFPLLAEAVRGVKVSVGAPFFNRMTLPLVVTLLFLMGVGPALPWGRATLAQIKRDFVPPLLALLVVVGGCLAFGIRTPIVLAAFGFAAFAGVTSVAEFVKGAAKRMRAHGENPVQALGRLIASNQRRYGGYTAHLGIVLMAIGITASSAFQVERDATLRPGQSLTIGKYEVRFDRIWAEEQPQRYVVGADMSVLIGGAPAGNLSPRLNYYRSRGEPITTPAVRTRADADLYLNLMAFERDGSTATIRAIVEPMVAWIWVGGFVIALGALVGIWPRRRAPRRTGGDWVLEPEIGDEPQAAAPSRGRARALAVASGDRQGGHS